MTNFTAFFNRHFEVVTDAKSEVVSEALKLRYQVYCLERGFEKKENFADGRERDHFDRKALHGIVQHRGSGTTLATVRLVAQNAERGTSAFPLERAYPDLFLQHRICERTLPRDTTREISRFAISKQCRQSVQSLVASDEAVAQRRALGWQFNGRCYPLVTFGLFVALMRLSAANGITHWLAVMEPSLLRLLSRFGVEFTPIGGVIDYHGQRQPCYGRVEEITERVGGDQLDLAALVKNDMAPSYLKAAS